MADGGLAFGTVDREEIKRFVIGVGKTYRYDKVPETDVCPGCERFLNPELLELHLASFFSLLFPFASFFPFFFRRASRTSVFELNLT